MDVDLIVNSVNLEPKIGGGVDFAIHEVGGRDLVQSRIKLVPIKTGQVPYSDGYLLHLNMSFIPLVMSEKMDIPVKKDYSMVAI